MPSLLVLLVCLCKSFKELFSFAYAQVFERKRMQRYDYFLNWQIFLQLFLLKKEKSLRFMKKRRLFSPITLPNLSRGVQIFEANIRTD